MSCSDPISVFVGFTETYGPFKVKKKVNLISQGKKFTLCPEIKNFGIDCKTSTTKSCKDWNVKVCTPYPSCCKSKKILRKNVCYEPCTRYGNPCTTTCKVWSSITKTVCNGRVTIPPVIVDIVPKINISHDSSTTLFFQAKQGFDFTEFSPEIINLIQITELEFTNFKVEINGSTNDKFNLLLQDSMDKALNTLVFPLALEQDNGSFDVQKLLFNIEIDLTGNENIEIFPGGERSYSAGYFKEGKGSITVNMSVSILLCATPIDGASFINLLFSVDFASNFENYKNLNNYAILSFDYLVPLTEEDD